MQSGTFRFVCQVFGFALALSGGLWSLQGFGVIGWPTDSFMLGQSQWGLYGLVTFAAGAGLLWLSRRGK